MQGLCCCCLAYEQDCLAGFLSLPPCTPKVNQSGARDCLRLTQEGQGRVETVSCVYFGWSKITRGITRVGEASLTMLVEGIGPEVSSDIANYLQVMLVGYEPVLPVH